MSIQQIHHSSGTVMGGPWQIRHRTQSGIDARLVAQTAYDALYEVERQMSHFIPESDLMRLNRAAVGEWITVPAEMLTVLEASRELNKFTDGAIDVNLGKAIDDWGFGAKSVADGQEVGSHCTDASPHELNAVSSNINCGYEIDWELNSPKGKVKKTRGITLNFASIAKGFAVDSAAQRVSKMGIQNFMIEAAGEISVKGKRADNMRWQIGLELPVPNQTLVYEQLALTNISLATSGSYRKYREINGKHVSHTLDPSNQNPIDSDLLSVSIFHEQCMYADALATALFVMGVANGSKFAEDHNISALFLIKDPEGICEIRSKAWMKQITNLN